MNFIAPMLYGFFGAIIALALLMLGFFLGWKLRAGLAKPPSAPYAAQTSEPIPAPTAEEIEAAKRLRKELEDEHAAFRTVVNYNTDIAYGNTVDLQELAKKRE